jgi:membrane protease YdiL (CAAX protease family)
MLERLAKTAKTYWLIPAFAAYAVLASLALPLIPRLGSLPMAAVLAVSETVMFLPPVLAFLAIARPNPREALFLRPLDAKNILLVSIMSITLIPVGSLISAASSMAFPNAAQEVLSKTREGPAWLALLSLGLVPAVLEEALFRGAILFQAKDADLKTAAFISGLFFGVMHLNPQQFPYAFFMGFFFALFVRRAGSIFASILAHMLFNSTSVLLSLIPAPIEDAEPSGAPILIFAAVAACCWILFLRTYQVFQKRNPDKA